MKIDSHQHFWHYTPGAFPWINTEMHCIARDFLPAHLETELAASGIDGTIAVQARQSLEETHFLLQLARQYPFIKGVVGWVDLRSHDLDEQLRFFVRDACFKGVRHVLHDETDDNFMLQKSFMAGIEQLSVYGLTYDLLVRPRHLSNVITLVQYFPQQPFVIDHLAKPDFRSGSLPEWRRAMETIAAFPNVMCKLSGLVTEATWHAWKQTDFLPYLDVAFNAFGPGRLMMGSDWPVCLVAASSYARVIRIVTDFLQNKGQPAYHQVMGTSAARFYNL